MTDFIKSKIEWQNNIYKTFQNSSKNLAEYNILQQAISEVSDLIYEKKNNYYNALAKKNCQTLKLVPKHTGLY